MTNSYEWVHQEKKKEEKRDPWVKRKKGLRTIEIDQIKQHCTYAVSLVYQTESLPETRGALRRDPTDRRHGLVNRTDSN